MRSSTCPAHRRHRSPRPRDDDSGPVAAGFPLCRVCDRRHAGPGRPGAESPSASAARDQAAGLHRAITSLSSRFGSRYPQGGAFLARVENIEARLASGPDENALAALETLRREALSAHPLVREAPILFVVRTQYRSDHHNTATFFPGAEHEYNDGAFTPGGALKLIDFAQGGAARTLLDVPQGVARDPDVSFDGKTILFSMRRNLADSYHLYEIHADGSGLKQLTFAPDVDDFDPLYLPDGAIVFSSTREPKYCMCNRHIMANLYRMDGDGANIHQIGKSTLFEGHARSCRTAGSCTTAGSTWIGTSGTPRRSGRSIPTARIRHCTGGTTRRRRGPSSMRSRSPEPSWRSASSVLATTAPGVRWRSSIAGWGWTGRGRSCASGRTTPGASSRRPAGRRSTPSSRSG